MGHVERHLQKTDEELIIRLLKDWKLFSGCLYDEAIDMINEKLSNLTFEHRAQTAFTLDFDEIIGFGYSRKFEKIYSKSARVVVVGNNENYDLITAYPDLEKGFSSGEFYDFSHCPEINDTLMGKLFLFLHAKHCLDVRYLAGKTPCVKVSLPNYGLRIKNNKFTVIDDSYGRVKYYEYFLPETFSFDDIFELIQKIKDFKEIHNIFEHVTIETFVQNQIKK